MWKKKQDDFRRRSIVWSSAISAVACLVLSIVDYLRVGLEATHWNIFYLATILFALGVYLLSEKRVLWALFVAAIPVVHHGLAQPADTLLAYFWIYPFPIILFFVLGLRAGTMVVGGLLAAIGAVAVVRAPPLGLSGPAFEMMISLSVVSVLSWLYESMRGVYLRELEVVTTTDALTGIANRRSFNQQLSTKLEEASGGSGGFGLLLVDLDNFKFVNDTLGHRAGDALLVEFSSEIAARLHASHLLARIGGDEFAVLLDAAGLAQQHESPEAGLRAQSKMLTELVESHDFTVDAQVTTSVGATLYRPGDDPETIYQRADEALYRAKEAGRNRSEVAA